MFKWAVLLFVAYMMLAPRADVYGTSGEVERPFRPEVYEEPEFLADCEEYEMEICYEPIRKRAKF